MLLRLAPVPKPGLCPSRVRAFAVSRPSRLGQPRRTTGRSENLIDAAGIQSFSQRSPRFQRIRMKPPGFQSLWREQIEDEPGQLIALAEGNQGQSSRRIETVDIEGLQLAQCLV